MLKNLFTSKESRGKRALMNPIDDACNMSKEDIREVLYKQLRSTCDYITLGDIKYRKIDADCWQCESTGVNYSDNVMHQIVEFFEEQSNTIANYSLYKIN